MAKQDGSIQVLNKAAGVLDLLADRGEMTVADIAESLGEPRSSVYRLLASLESIDMIEPGVDRSTHRLGLHLLRLGSAVTARFDERQAALPAMESIHAATGETVFLCVRRGDEAVCIERLDGKRVQSLELRLGGSLPMHRGAAPRTLLAFSPDEVIDAYAASGNLERNGGPKMTRRALLADVEEIRERGYAISDEDVTPGIAAVGAPLFDYRSEVRAALSISGTKPAILGDRDATVALVLEAASRASRVLGYDG